MQTKQITTDFEWKPTSNTVAYYKLDSVNTVNDLSSHKYNLTNNGTLFGTYAGVDCAYFPNSSSGDNNKGLYTTAFGIQTNMTVSLRFYQISFPNRYNCQFQFGTGTRGYVLGTWINEDGEVCIGAWASPETIVNKGNTYQGARHYMCVVKTGTSCVLYIDNTQIATLNFNISVPNRFNIGAQPVDSSDLYGYMSRVIVENVARTQQNRIDYYNKTKKYFGL